MLAFTNSKEKQSPTVIGAGCHIKGNIKTDHTIQIHGEIVGDVTADTIVIGLGGRVVGKVTATILFLHGTMEGPATVDTAHVFRNAQMSGNLSYHTLNITGNTGLECRLIKRKDK